MDEWMGHDTAVYLCIGYCSVSGILRQFQGAVGTSNWAETPCLGGHCKPLSVLMSLSLSLCVSSSWGV